MKVERERPGLIANLERLSYFAEAILSASLR
jgi:hypothetical protein